MDCHLNIGSAAVAALVATAFLAGCGGDSKPQAPQPGTAAYNWMTAKQAFEKGEYTKAHALMMKVTSGKSEFADQARPLALITSISMARASMELSEKFAEGTKRTRGDAMPFRRSTSLYRAQAKAAAMQFLEEARQFIDVNKDKDVTLGVAAPAASGEAPPQYAKITSGQVVPDAEIAGVERELIGAKIAEYMKAAGAAGAETPAPGQKYLLALANGLFDVVDMFSPKKLLQPTRIVVVACDEALEALAMVKDSKEARELEKKVTAAKKKLPAES